MQKLWERIKAAAKSILSWAKVHTKTAAIVVLIVVTLFFGLRSCRVGPAEERAAKAEALADAAQKAEAKAKHDYDLDRSVWEHQKKELNKKVEAAMEVIATLSGQIDSSNFTLAELERILANAKTFEAKYYAQVPIIAEYKKREASYWKPLIDEQDKIILATKQAVVGERVLRLKAEAGWDICKIALEKEQKESRAKDGVISRLKWKNTLTVGGGLLGAAAGFGFGMLLGK